MRVMIRGRRLAALAVVLPVVGVGTAYVASNNLPTTHAGVTTQAVSFPISLTAQDATASGNATDGYAVPASATLSFAISSVSGPVTGETITFTAGSKNCHATTDSGGTASCTISDLPDVPSTYTAVFAGDGSIQASSDTATVTPPVPPKPPSP